jgi:hypothetical protein
VPGELRLWDLDSGKLLFKVSLGERAGSSVTFSPDGYFVAFPSSPGAVELWEVATGMQARRLVEKGAHFSDLAFAPGGRRLAALSNSRAVTVWDLAPPGFAELGKLSQAEVRRCLAALADPDAARAYPAMWTLTADPSTALPLLGQSLSPVRPEKAETIRRLVAELDHDKFARREEAGRELARLGPQAGPALRRALADAKTSREARSRIEPLLKALDQWLVTDRETLRGLRAVWVLERIGSPDARAILKRLAGGAPEARLTKAAKSALGRLKSR